jgi:hypothetical protein
MDQAKASGDLWPITAYLALRLNSRLMLERAAPTRQFLKPTGPLKGSDLVSSFLDEIAAAHSWQTLLGGRASRIMPHPTHPLSVPIAAAVRS